MRLLITGATGFLGKNIVSRIDKSQYSVTGTYRSTTPDEAADVRFTQLDLSRKEDVSKIFQQENYDAVIHLATHMKGDRAGDYIKNSILATQYLIDAAEQVGVSAFVYMSSIAVYGYVDGIVSETSDRVDLNDYGTAKYLGERLLSDSKIPCRLSIRLPRMLGYGMDLSYPWIPSLIGKLIRGDDISYFNPELMYNNMAYVDTLTKFLEVWLQGAKKGYHLCTLGAAEPMTVFDIVQMLKDGLQSRSTLYERKDNIPRNTAHYIDITQSKLLGYSPLTCRETLRLTIQDICKEYGIDE